MTITDEMVEMALNATTEELPEGVQYALIRGLKAMGWEIAITGSHDVMHAALTAALEGREEPDATAYSDAACAQDVADGRLRVSETAVSIDGWRERAERAEAALVAMSHVANEWADAATSAPDMLKNVRDGIGTVSEYLMLLAEQFEHCRALWTEANKLAASGGGNV